MLGFEAWVRYHIVTVPPNILRAGSWWIQVLGITGAMSLSRQLNVPSFELCIRVKAPADTDRLLHMISCLP